MDPAPWRQTNPSPTMSSRPKITTLVLTGDDGCSWNMTLNVWFDDANVDWNAYAPRTGLVCRRTKRRCRLRLTGRDFHGWDASRSCRHADARHCGPDARCYRDFRGSGPAGVRQDPCGDRGSWDDHSLVRWTARLTHSAMSGSRGPAVHRYRRHGLPEEH